LGKKKEGHESAPKNERAISKENKDGHKKNSKW